MSESLRPDWIVLDPQRPAQRGVISVAHSQVQSVVGEPEATTCDCEGLIALPAFINPHTHLEFSHLAEPLGEAGTAFPNWIETVVRNRRQAATELDASHAASQRASAIGRGLRECLLSGTAAIGEIGSANCDSTIYDPCQALKDGPAILRDCTKTTVYREVIGLAAARCESGEQLAEEHLHPSRDQHELTGLVRGISPHAPYTVGTTLLQRLCQLAASESAPLAMHLAESAEEIQLLRSGDGLFLDVLQQLGAWDPDAFADARSPRDYLGILAHAPRSLVIHGNYLHSEDWSFLAEHRSAMSVVYCPRTHSYFRHADYPLAEMLQRGVRLAIGTDSRASNPDLSMFRELQHAWQKHPDVPSAEILAMGTSLAATALGLDSRWGNLRPGSWANLVLVRPGGGDAVIDTALSPDAQLAGVMLGGHWLVKP